MAKKSESTPQTTDAAIHIGTCITLDRQDWFKRRDFVKYVNAPGVATWNLKDERPRPGEYTDVFCTYDHDEGCDTDKIPEDIWAEICRVCHDYGIEYAIIRIANTE